MNFVYVLLLVLLAGCASNPVKQETNITPLLEVVSNIKTGMSMNEVNSALNGRKPVLRYTSIDKNRFLWEFSERNTDKKSNTIESNSATIIFNSQGKVINTNSSFCFLPDQDPAIEESPQTKCYQEHIYNFEKHVVYDAIKRFLLISNYQVEHSDAASEIITALGSHSVEGDKKKMMYIKLTVIFTGKEEDVTEVIMSASFSISEKQATFVQAGFAGVTIPVPLPFHNKTEWIKSGVVTPRFYLNFYDALSSLIANKYLMYQEPNVGDEPPTVLSKTIQPPTIANEVKGAIGNSAGVKKIQSTDIKTQSETNNAKLIPEVKGYTNIDSNLESSSKSKVNHTERVEAVVEEQTVKEK